MGFAGVGGVSRDGLIVVGVGATTSGNRAFRWTSAGGMTSLGVLPTGTHSFASGISAEGGAIIGDSTIPAGRRAFRWTAAVGMLNLGTLPPPLDATSSAIGVNANGLVIVGSSGNSTSSMSRGFLWTPGLGMVDLATFLQSLGINLTGWTRLSPGGVSDDGLTIVGGGDHNNQTEARIATLGPRCLANCDSSFIPPALNVNDFICFNNRFGAGDSYANCDGSTIPPVLNVSDFVCFLNKYAAGCS